MIKKVGGPKKCPDCGKFMKKISDGEKISYRCYNCYPARDIGSQKEDWGAYLIRVGIIK